MGKSGQPVGEGVDEGTLYNGPGHAPTSGYPWQEGANVYIAGHVLGYEGTGSYMDFAALPNMSYGDEIILTDANGTTYTYVVSEILQVSIYDLWVMDPTGANQVSLQTCINPPAYDVRLVVRGDLQSVVPA
jgi:sortase A